MYLESEAASGTRERVRAAVLTHGPISALELGNMLGLTPAAIRRHLDALEKSEEIEVKLVRGEGRAGRPARRFVASDKTREHLENEYSQIALQAMAQLKELGGQEAVERFAQQRFEQMRVRYQAEIDAVGSSVRERAEKLAELLSRDGFVGTTRDVGLGLPAAMKSIQVCQGNCPLQALAQEYPEFCEKEADVFASLLGVDVRRLSTLVNGAHVCTTHVPLGREHIG